MPKVKLNKLIESISGRVGELILYEADGQNLARRMPEANAERTESQDANSHRFKAAGIYARAATADPLLKAAYEAACVGHQNARNLAIRDAMRPPVIQELHLEGYTGKPAELLRVKATDDFRVKTVLLTIRDPQGNLIEEGPAEWNRETDEWLYLTRVAVASGQTVSVAALAKDHPGNTAEAQRWHYLG